MKNTYKLPLSLSMIRLSLLGAWLADCFRVTLSSHRKNLKWLKRDTPYTNQNHETKLLIGSPASTPSLKSNFFFTFWEYQNPKITRGTHLPHTWALPIPSHSHSTGKRSKRSLPIPMPRGTPQTPAQQNLRIWTTLKAKNHLHVKVCTYICAQVLCLANYCNINM